MNVTPERFGIKEVADVTFYNTVTNKPEIFLDTLKVSTLDFTAEQTFARGGKGNPKVIGWDFNREIALTLQDALVSQKFMSMLAGQDITSGAAIAVSKYDEDVLDASLEMTLAGLPDGSTPTVLNAYFVNTAGVETTVTATSVSDDVSYAIVGGVVTLTNNGTPAVSAAEGDNLIVAYTYMPDAAEQLVFTAADFPGTYKIVGDTLVRDEDGVDHPYQFVCYRGKIQPNFTLTMAAEGDPSVFDMNIDVLRNTDGNMIEFIKY